MKHYYTEKQYKELISNMVILRTNNEQKNDHIIETFDKKGIKHEGRSLETGDYCFKILANTELGVVKDWWFVDELCIERKNSVDELAGCMKDIAFHNEIRRMSKIKYAYILVENDRIDDIIAGNYVSQYNSNAMLRTLLKWEQKYGIRTIFVKKANMARMIYEICVTTLGQYILK
jgi:ERCC4-type nuclease